jgi:ABC-type Fe3+-hydroxamate transport system substrate-binding protein
MYAVVRRYKGATALFDELARREQDVRSVIQGVPGFVAYYLVRSDDGGATITICQDQSGTAESTRRAADWVRQNVPAAAGNPPEVTEGEVLFNF